jgi:hypothetical protein
MQSLTLDERGDQLLKMKGGDVRWHKPVVYQEVNGERREIAARYVIEDREQEVRFHIGAYDHDRPLVIDPTLIYPTYFGGASTEQSYGIAVDTSGSAYITGTALDAFPTTQGAFQTTDRDAPFTFAGEAFVSKLNAAGTAVVYSTYLGGSDLDTGYGIGVDAHGNAHVTGVTCSADFPILNAYQPIKSGGCDAFLTKLNADGTGLLYSTFVGGQADETARSLALDNAGNAYIAGE